MPYGEVNNRSLRSYCYVLRDICRYLAVNESTRSFAFNEFCTISDLLVALSIFRYSNPPIIYMNPFHATQCNVRRFVLNIYEHAELKSNYRNVGSYYIRTNKNCWNREKLNSHPCNIIPYALHGTRNMFNDINKILI